LNSLNFKTSQEWRNWLASRHDKEKEVWLIFYKKETGIQSINYEAAVEEALCFGWIDSIIKKIDDSKYARKFTPRNNSSKWSQINKKRIEQLIKNRRMTQAGMLLVDNAKKSGQWDKSDKPIISFDPPEDFLQALKQNNNAKVFFENLAATYQKQFIVWINIAKRPETRENRIRESIHLLEKREKLGLR
jgi:uncharacterized protein YdeI (YjbR/CyaY-like superfamily)